MAGRLPSNSPDTPFWLNRQWLRRTGSTTVGMWVSTAFAFAGTLIGARLLGTSGFGEVVLAGSVAALVATFLDLTMEEAVVHYGTKLITSEDYSGLRSMLVRALLLDIAIGAAIALAIVLAADVLADLASGGKLDPGFVRLAAAAVFASTANGTTGGALLVAGRPDVRGWSMTFTNVARLVAVTATASRGPGAVLAGFAVAQTAGAVAQGVLVWSLGWRDWSRAGTGSTTSAAWTMKLVRFAVHSSMTTGVLAAKNAFVPVVLGRVAGVSAVGAFEVALLPVSVVGVVTAPLRLALFGEQAKLAARRNRNRLLRSVEVYSLTGAGVGLIGALVGFAAMPTLIATLYGEDYLQAVIPARILLVAAYVALMTGWSKTLPAAVGRPGVRTRVALIELVVTAPLILSLGSAGASGAATAVAAASIVVGIAWVVELKHLLPLDESASAKRSNPKRSNPKRPPRIAAAGPGGTR